MLSHLMIKKGGQIFINATGGDVQENVIRRAARIALKLKCKVRYQIINREEYKTINVDDAEKIMTAELWINELRDYLSDPLSRKEAGQIKKNMKAAIVRKLKKKRAELHKNCLDWDKESKKIIKRLSI